MIVIKTWVIAATVQNVLDKTDIVYATTCEAWHVKS